LQFEQSYRVSFAIYGCSRELIHARTVTSRRVLVIVVIIIIIIITDVLILQISSLRTCSVKLETAQLHLDRTCIILTINGKRSNICLKTWKTERHLMT
jgi:hypothetical protein